MWLKIARANLTSAKAIVGTDVNGALILLWASMHKIAKALASGCGCGLRDETHGKMADFLRCAFTGHFPDRQLRQIQLLREGRNTTSYDRPDRPNPQLLVNGFDLADRMLELLDS